MQNSASVAKLTAEIERLQGIILNAQQEQAELTRLLTLMRKYSPLLADGPEPVGKSLEKIQQRLERRSGKVPTRKKQILDACQEILSDGRHRRSRELLPELSQRGIDIPGNDPAQSLAVYLSREKQRFTSDLKAGGWTLVRLPQKPSARGPLADLFEREDTYAR